MKIRSSLLGPLPIGLKIDQKFLSNILPKNDGRVSET